MNKLYQHQNVSRVLDSCIYILSLNYSIEYSIIHIATRDA
ncbi:9130_t:CDS:2 [Gigaspora margarita]|uniref:9130_t:CDS:1 n=1 Tax=Gigaspora margarita TaxID=4874 RepID=A0ABM8VXM4_GIGMA|nr:9130_t:CDS:2 [Gigaspora margarita]